LMDGTAKLCHPSKIVYFPEIGVVRDAEHLLPPQFPGSLGGQDACRNSRYRGTHRDFIPGAVGVHLQAQVRRRIERIVYVQLIAQESISIVEYDREMQVHAGGVAGIAGIVALVAELRPRFDVDLRAAGREGRVDQVAPVRIRHVSVVQPDLPAGLQWVAGDADGEGRFPVGAAGEVTGIGRHHGRDARARRMLRIRSAEDVDALVALAEFEGIVPQEAHVARSGQREYRVPAARPTLDGPIGMILGIPEPFAELTKTVRARAQVTVGLRAKPEDKEKGEEEYAPQDCESKFRLDWQTFQGCFS
jgi:hypothetical protein